MVLDENFDIRTFTAGVLTYVGKAPRGSATSDAYWQIKRVDQTSDIVITYADGTDKFDKVWDDLATYSY